MTEFYKEIFGHIQSSARVIHLFILLLVIMGKKVPKVWVPLLLRLLLSKLTKMCENPLCT